MARRTAERLASPFVQLRKIRMKRGDGLRPLAHRGGDPLDGAGAHVPDGKDTADARLQRRMILSQIAAGADEAFAVHSDCGRLQPIRIRLRATEQKYMADRPLRLFTG